MDKVTITKEIMDEGIVEASELGLAPGVWPSTLLFDGSFLTLSGFDQYGSGVYTSLFGSVTVVNS